MGKSRKFRGKLPENPQLTGANDLPLSRGQRKRAAKRSSLLKKKTLLVKKNAAPRRCENAKLPGIPSLSDIMGPLRMVSEGRSKSTAGSAASSLPISNSNRGKKRAIAVEMPQFLAVLQDDTFKAKSLVALKSYLEATLPRTNSVMVGRAAVNAAAVAGTSTGSRRRRKKARGGKHSKLRAR
jgi:hypothetical protein